MSFLFIIKFFVDLIILGFLSDKEKKSLAEAHDSLIIINKGGISTKESKAFLIAKRTVTTSPEVNTSWTLFIS